MRRIRYEVSVIVLCKCGSGGSVGGGSGGVGGGSGGGGGSISGVSSGGGYSGGVVSGSGSDRPIMMTASCWASSIRHPPFPH